MKPELLFLAAEFIAALAAVLLVAGLRARLSNAAPYPKLFSWMRVFFGIVAIWFAIGTVGVFYSSYPTSLGGKIVAAFLCVAMGGFLSSGFWCPLSSNY